MNEILIKNSGWSRVCEFKCKFLYAYVYMIIKSKIMLKRKKINKWIVFSQRKLTKNRLSFKTWFLSRKFEFSSTLQRRLRMTYRQLYKINIANRTGVHRKMYFLTLRTKWMRKNFSQSFAILMKLQFLYERQLYAYYYLPVLKTITMIFVTFKIVRLQLLRAYGKKKKKAVVSINEK